MLVFQGEDENELRGKAMVAEYSLIRCPTWTAGIALKKGGYEVEVAPEIPEWPHTHGGVCQACGQLVAGSELTGCPLMKDPERATLELIRLKAPPEMLHSEA